MLFSHHNFLGVMTKVAAFTAGALAAGTIFMTIIFGSMINTEINMIRNELKDEMDVFKVGFPKLCFTPNIT